MDHRQHQHHLELPSSRVQQRAGLAILPAHGRRRPRQVRMDRLDRRAGFAGSSAEQALGRVRIAFERHHLRAVLGRQRAEHTRVRSNIQHLAGFRSSSTLRIQSRFCSLSARCSGTAWPYSRPTPSLALLRHRRARPLAQVRATVRFSKCSVKLRRLCTGCSLCALVCPLFLGPAEPAASPARTPQRENRLRPTQRLIQLRRLISIALEQTSTPAASSASASSAAAAETSAHTAHTPAR